MTNEEWTAGHKKADDLAKWAEDPQSKEWFQIVEEYYTTELTNRMADIKQQAVATMDELRNSHGLRMEQEESEESLYYNETADSGRRLCK